MRQVLRRVREDQGPDAVILSNRRVDGGIEVIAAIDYDEALVRHALDTNLPTNRPISSDALAKIAEDDVADVESPTVEVVSAEIALATPTTCADSIVDPIAERSDGTTLRGMQADMSSMRSLLETQLSDLVWTDVARRSPMRAQVLRNMARLGLAPDIANIIVDRLEPKIDSKNIWSAPLTTLAQALPIVDDDLLQAGGTIALIGPTGVGKTTTIAKIAARFAMENWADDIALVSADAYRIGAKEHLSAFANIIGAKVYSASTFEELSETLDLLKKKKLVLIDTEGRSQRDRELSSRLAAYGRNSERVHYYLTLSAATQEAAIEETIREFRKVPLKGCIVTKIDEAAQLGCAMSALIRNDLPVAFFSDGQRIPDDLYGAARKRLWFVNKAVECLESSEPRINEQSMTEQYSRESIVNV